MEGVWNEKELILGFRIVGDWNYYKTYKLTENIHLKVSAADEGMQTSCRFKVHNKDVKDSLVDSEKNCDLLNKAGCPTACCGLV